MIGKRSRTKVLVALHDTLAAPLAMLAGAFLVQERLSAIHFELLASSALIAALPAVYLSGAHRHVWRYVSLREVAALTLAAVAVSAATLIFTVVTTSPEPALVSAAIVGFFVLLSLWIAPRAAIRLFRDQLRRPEEGHTAENVLIAGVGKRSEAFVRANAEHGRFRIVGLLSEDVSLHHRKVNGVPVLGSFRDLDRILVHQQLRGGRPTRLIVGDDGLSKDELALTLEHAAAHGLTLSRIPSSTDLRGGSADQIQPVAINDLLSRAPMVLDHSEMAALVRGRTVLITGAGGSIGSELVRQTAALGPRLLILVESNEFNLYRIDMECARRFPNIRRVTALCDVRDRTALARWFEAHRPALVFHAAALKHVPMIEDHPEEGVLTNVLGTRNVAELSRQFGVASMVLVSTDKAVNPTNVMGATKRCAEVLCQGFDQMRRSGGGGTRHLAVRFGNVLGSAGSVVPLFTQQIAEGGPVTVTHAEMTRFFMTIPEAVQLILQATATSMSSGDDVGGVYVLDMGEPVRIYDLAERIIQLSGKRPHVDVPIQIVGLRPGEKLHEELAHTEEDLTRLGETGVMLARPRAAPLPVALAAADRMVQAARAGDRDGLILAIKELAPEFEPTTAEYALAASGYKPQPRIRAVV